MTPYYQGNYYRRKKHGSTMPINFFLLLLIVFIAILGIIQNNAITAYAFKIKDLNEQANGLSAVNQLLEAKIMHFQSMANLNLISDAGDNEMAKISKVNYLVPNESTVAVR